MLKMDITDIHYPDGTFDVCYCSHVLQHVPEDRKAIQELFRTLKPDGWALILVPLSGEKTFEDQTITEPAARLAAYGHDDFVRRCGRDYIDRLTAVGFKVSVIKISDLVGERESVLMGLSSHVGAVYYCRK